MEGVIIISACLGILSIIGVGILAWCCIDSNRRIAFLEEELVDFLDTQKANPPKPEEDKEKKLQDKKSRTMWD